MAITHTNAMLDATGKWSAQEQQRQLWSVTEWSFPVHHNIHNQLHIHNSQRHDSTNDQFCNSQCTQHSGVCCMADVYRFLTFLSIRITTTTWITTSTMTTTTTTTSCSSGLVVVVAALVVVNRTPVIYLSIFNYSDSIGLAIISDTKNLISLNYTQCFAECNKTCN